MRQRMARSNNQVILRKRAMDTYTSYKQAEMDWNLDMMHSYAWLFVLFLVFIITSGVVLLWLFTQLTVLCFTIWAVAMLGLAIVSLIDHLLS